MECIYISSRSVTVLLDPKGDYYASAPRRLTLNGADIGMEERSVFSLFGLWPDTDYILESELDGQKESTVQFRTAKEVCTLNVKRFGALGDGEHDDTPMLQAA
ncbi:MAG: glycoside hydrolase family 28 protein, partial [Clostridia bacterium]|nr:glycoside hydrolase family 28 protein [Clostridia bacterium]